MAEIKTHTMSFGGRRVGAAHADGFGGLRPPYTFHG
jgi:hypothetical protein